ncbi:DNA primase large subunit isoform X6 [Emydura macquarii macquarii]|uniref:DNA primase large subunit isoform X6 n=1 Tax=Emydura macquarii macquarii TaxID=1129001 RepID=UPI00352B4B5A
MEFTRERRMKTRLAGDRRGDLYPHSLQFYGQPPTENISLAEFESFAIDRLKLLKVVENLGVSYVKGGDEYKSRLEHELRKLKFPYKALIEDDYDARRKDHISHFILRLAYCQSEDLRRWFIQQEMDLFRYRFNELTDDLVQKFLKYVNLPYGAKQTLLWKTYAVHIWPSFSKQKTGVRSAGEGTVTDLLKRNIRVILVVEENVILHFFMVKYKFLLYVCIILLYHSSCQLLCFLLLV